ncbi:uv-b-insensitive 4 [Euphorbia peplus]|nr:uv-b-insensitive 4 [Euphorbia peplus]
MAQSRYRLSRPFDLDDLFTPTRLAVLGVYQHPEFLQTFLNPRAGLGMGGLGMFATPTRAIQNSRGPPSRSVLPHWYPRTPLRDITAVVRAYERRRELVGGSRAQEIETPMPRTYWVGTSSISSPGAHLEHSNSMKTPAPKTAIKRCPPSVGKVPQILLAAANEPSEGSELLTPEKKLLNSIEKVEKQVMQELKKLARTSSAKKADRETKVRTLMSFR